MRSLILRVTNEQTKLVQELLEKILQDQSAISNSANGTESEIKEAQFTSDCVELLLQALKQGYTSVEMPRTIFKPVLAQLTAKLKSQMAIMIDLMQDDSLVEDNLVQVFTRGIELLHIMRAMTHEALQVNSHDSHASPMVA